MPKTKSYFAKFGLAVKRIGFAISLVLIAFVIISQIFWFMSFERSRLRLSDSVAVQVSRLIAEDKMERLESVLDLAVEFNRDLLAVSVISKEGQLILQLGGYPADSPESPPSFNKIERPLLIGEKSWGQLELVFTKTNSFAGIRLGHGQLLLLVFATSIAGIFLFCRNLGKMSRILDPDESITPQIRSALETMPDGLVVIDLYGKIVLANATFANLVGMNVDAVVGWRVGGFPWINTEGARIDPTKLPWCQLLEKGLKKDRRDKIVFDNGKGPRKTCVVTCSPIVSGRNKKTGMIVGFKDVTDLEEKENQLEIAQQQASEATRVKTEFLLNLSHEIRTPMNAILGFTDILRRGYEKDNSEAQRYLDSIYSSGEDLLKLINDILDFSKIEAGSVQVENVRCHPWMLINDVAYAFAKKANAADVELELRTEGEIPNFIHSDPLRIQQVVGNLVENSIKFSQHGVVEVVIKMDDPDSQLLQIEVRDSGIGISPEQIEKIFEPFAQADSSVTRQQAGTGLGLTLARRFSQALGGQLTVRSKPEEGSVFSVTIQTGSLKGVEMCTPGIKQFDGSDLSESAELHPLSKKRILVVDDGKENLDLVSLVLRTVGIEVDCAADGQVGYEMGKNQHYDMILMDIQMPIMDGFTATRRLREYGCETPIFALTAHATEGIGTECMQAGCNGLLTKPIDLDLLTRTVGEVVTGGGFPGIGQVHNSISIDSESPVVSTLPTDIPEFMEILKEFVPRLHDRLDDMQDSWNRDDLAQLADHAHWLKGCGGTLGFEEFTEPSARLERLAKQSERKLIESTLAELRGIANRIVLHDDRSIQGQNQGAATLSSVDPKSGPANQTTVSSS
ncbi:ATP-binding protein [Pirellulaceae bacterium]|nr:ATP-binding protein [Pirellulaceae bacterium]